MRVVIGKSVFHCLVPGVDDFDNLFVVQIVEIESKFHFAPPFIAASRVLVALQAMWLRNR